MLRTTEAQTYGDVVVTSHDLSTQAAMEILAANDEDVQIIGEIVESDQAAPEVRFTA